MMHPYTEFEKTDLWQTLEKAIQYLSNNADIKELTDRTYIIGYIAKTLSESGQLKITTRKIDPSS